MSLSEDLWKDALHRVNSTTSCARLTLIRFKVLHRIHVTKAKASKMFPDLNDICDRCLLSSANHTHMFFSCPKLSNYWSYFFDIMSKALDVSLKPCPFISIFGVMEDGDAGLFLFGRSQKIIIALENCIVIAFSMQ